MENENQLPTEKPKFEMLKIITNLTKPQKAVFCVLMLIILCLVGLSIYLSFELSRANQKNQQAVKVAADIQKMSCDEAKTTLSQVNSDPDLIQIYKNVTIDSVNGDNISFYTDQGVFQSLNLTNETEIKKDTGSSFIAGRQEDLKKGVKISMIKANPMGEVEYVGYSL